MRNITIALTEMLGAVHIQDINYFISEQFQRVSITDGVAISLKDVDEDTITRLIKSTVTQLGLSPEEVLKSMIIVPYVSSQCTVEPAIEFKSNIYESLLSNIAKVKAVLIREGDAYTFSGKSKHVVYKKGGGHDEIVGGFINGEFLNNNKPFSVLIKGEEWLQSMTSIIDNKYNCTIVDDDEWERAVMEGILFRRLSDELAGTLLGESEPDKETKFRMLQEFGAEMFDSVSEVGGSVYSSFGYAIGKTFRKFSMKDKVTKEQKSVTVDKNTKHLKVVVNNSSKQPSGDIDSVTPESMIVKETFDAWGEF